jgi:hypothetical protein
MQKNKSYRALLVIATGALFAIHPLAGLPLAGFLPLAFFPKTSRIRSIAALCASALAPSAAFILVSNISPHLSVEIHSFNPSAIASFFSYFLPHWEWRFHALLDPVYLITQNMHFLLLSAGVASWILTRKSSRGVRRAMSMLSIGFIGASLSYIVTRGFVSFPTLPIYEQAIYTDRIKEISLLFLAVGGGLAVGAGIEKILQQKNRFFALIAVLILSAVGAMHVYASYPRNDAYVPYHGHTVSRHDISAVHWIRNHAGGKDYVVLANQVSAGAAIREFGFAKYYSIPRDNALYDAFYYSIPAASPLHDMFLAMLAGPSRTIIENVKALARVDRVYVIVHKYEPRFRNVIDKIKPLADVYTSIGDEAVSIFGFYPQ